MPWWDYLGVDPDTSDLLETVLADTFTPIFFRRDRHWHLPSTEDPPYLFLIVVGRWTDPPGPGSRSYITELKFPEHLDTEIPNVADLVNLNRELSAFRRDRIQQNIAGQRFAADEHHEARNRTNYAPH